MQLAQAAKQHDIGVIWWIAELEATRPHVGGSGKYLVLILLASKRYMIVSFIETTDLTPK